MRWCGKGLGLAIALVGCATDAGSNGAGIHAPPGPPGTAAPSSPITFHAPEHGPTTSMSPAITIDERRYDRQIATAFETIRAQHQDLGYPAMLQRLGVARPPDASPSFDPTKVAYYDLIRQTLQLTPEEQEIFRRTGVVGVDHVQRYSMAIAYLKIYHRDLPVLITSDSILHAMHRSFDKVLAELESGFFATTIRKVLIDAHAALRAESGALTNPTLRRSAEDVDLYLAVARSLIDGISIRSELGQDAKVTPVLDAIRAETPGAGVNLSLYGRAQTRIDWSQFKPRGHYTKTIALRNYFRAMMWLGRADVGFNLAAPDPAFGQVDVVREVRAAALLAWLVRRAGQGEALAGIDSAIGFLVGLSDNVSIADMAGAIDRAGVKRAADLARADIPAAIAARLRDGEDRRQRIRSQLGKRAPSERPEVPLPEIFQLFGQRFVIDSFITSKLVFDSITFEGKQQRRDMPTGLDVMAALGNDEAVGLLAPEIETWKYAANLVAARRVIEDRPAATWNATMYDLWLSALAKLDDVPEGSAFPQVMRSRAWARKQLQTQLGSWAELRHDTILYVKQSYTDGEICDYPAGYVEPYPEFYARVALFAEEGAKRLGALKVSNATHIMTFFNRFASIVRTLQRLAAKELAGKPFDAEERKFIKETIKFEPHSDGCGGGPVRLYTGWYPQLIYDDQPEAWEPTIADVHTGGGEVLEAAVGDVNLVVAAIDNGADRAAYVGPIYSYYEFTSPQRLTDEEWRGRIPEGPLPARPDWVRAFQARRAVREIALPKK